MRITFISGNIEVFYDDLTVFDGPSQFSPQIAQVDGNIAGLSYTATNAGGCISLK